VDCEKNRALDYLGYHLGCAGIPFDSWCIRWALEKEFDKETQEKMEKALDKTMEESRCPAAIVEEVTGKDLGVVIREKIIDRLGLNNTVFATQPDIKGDHLYGYAVLENRTIDVTTQPSISILWASGNMISNLQIKRNGQERWGAGRC